MMLKAKILNSYKVNGLLAEIQTSYASYFNRYRHPRSLPSIEISENTTSLSNEKSKFPVTKILL